jgi:hypothetical protein
MKLEVEGCRAIVDPRSSALQSAVSSLSHPAPSFLILSRSEATYLQVAVTAPGQFVVEYRERSVPQHFQSVRSDLSGDEVVRILEAFRQGEDSWRQENEWRQIDRAPPPDPWGRVRQLSVIAGFILFLAAVLSLRTGRDPIFGLEPMKALSVAFVAFLPTLIIDLRKFRSIDAQDKVYTIAALGIGVMLAVYWVLESAGR